MRKLFVLLWMPMAVLAQQLVYSYTVDTNQYNGPLSYISVVPGTFPTTITGLRMGAVGMPGVTDFMYVYQKKNTEEYDIFSFTGKVGSFIIHDADISAGFWEITVSQTIVNADSNWECLISYELNSFKVLDGAGNQILADSGGNAQYGWDGQNTYVFVSYPIFKAWQFRTNIGNAAQPLAKSLSSTHPPIMSLMPSGALRVTLQPAGSGQTSVRIMDMLGRLVYNRVIPEMKASTTFTIPSTGLPKSPFVANVTNGNGSFVREQIPVH